MVPDRSSRRSVAVKGADSSSLNRPSGARRAWSSTSWPACSPAAISSSRTSPAWARRRSPRPSRRRSAAGSPASNARPTCCPATSPGSASTTRRPASSSSCRAPSSPTCSWPTRSTAPRRARRVPAGSDGRAPGHGGQRPARALRHLLRHRHAEPGRAARDVPLPEAQLDRFAMKLRIGYPGADHELDDARGGRRPRADGDESVTPVTEPAPARGPSRTSGPGRRRARRSASYLVALARRDARSHRQVTLGPEPAGSADLAAAGAGAAPSSPAAITSPPTTSRTSPGPCWTSGSASSPDAVRPRSTPRSGFGPGTRSTPQSNPVEQEPHNEDPFVFDIGIQLAVHSSRLSRQSARECGGRARARPLCAGTQAEAPARCRATSQRIQPRHWLEAFGRGRTAPLPTIGRSRWRA